MCYIYSHWSHVVTCWKNRIMVGFYWQRHHNTWLWILQCQRSASHRILLYLSPQKHITCHTHTVTKTYDMSCNTIKNEVPMTTKQFTTHSLQLHYKNLFSKLIVIYIRCAEQMSVFLCNRNQLDKKYIPPKAHQTTCTHPLH